MKSDVHLAKSQYMLHINCTIFTPNEDVAHSKESFKNSATLKRIRKIFLFSPRHSVSF